MNREIKFRFWLPKLSKMTYGHYLKDCSKVVLDFMPEANPMQYTGLKDSKGTDVYEGDLIVSGEDFPYVLVVGFNKETASFGGCRDASMCLEGWYSFLNDIVIDRDGWEIIGNIHQHPNLLK